MVWMMASFDAACATAQVPYTCSQCGKIVYSFAGLRQHTRRFHSASTSRQFGCAFCLRYCFSKSDLVCHLRIHTGERPFKCAYCDATFGSTAARCKHVRACHVTTKRFGCSRCLGYFEDRRKLHDHIQSRCRNVRIVAHSCFSSTRCQFCGLLLKRLFSHQILHHSEFRTFCCFYCPKRFFSDEQKYAHESSVHRTSKFLKCPHCERRFYQTSELSKHVAKFHVRHLKYVCKFCGKRFVLRYDRILHEKIHVETFPCEICEKRFSSLTAKNLHSRVHSGTEPYACAHCDKRFLWRSTWSRHVTYVHGNAASVKGFGCAHCEIRFHLQPQLIQHLRLHTGETPFQCKNCGESFHSRQLLRYHERRHSADQCLSKPHTCRVCRRSFSTELERKAHLLTHRKLPAVFACALCSKKFISMHSLRVHVRRKHQSVPDAGIQCRFCDKRFTSYFLKLKHERFHNGIAWTLSCKTCGRRFEVRRALLQHEQTHLAPPVAKNDLTFPCRFCDGVFFSPYDRRKHVFEAHSGVKFMCEFCPRDFWNKALRAGHMKRQHAEQMGLPNENTTNMQSSYGVVPDKPVYSNNAEIGPQMPKHVRVPCTVCGRLLSRTTLGHWLEHLPAITVESAVSIGPSTSSESCNKGDRSEKSFKCSFCERSFALLREINSHIWSKHPETFGQTNFIATDAIPVSSPKKITAHRRRSSAVCISELVDSVVSEAAAKAADSLVTVAKVTDSHTEVPSISTNGLPVDSSAACGSTLVNAVVVSEVAVYALNEDSGSDVEIINDVDDGIPAVDLITMPSRLRSHSSVLSEAGTSAGATSGKSNSGLQNQAASIQRQHCERNYPYPKLFALLAVPEKASYHYSAAKTGSPKKPALQTLSSILSETCSPEMSRSTGVQQYQSSRCRYSDHTYHWRSTSSDSLTASPNESCHLPATASASKAVGRQDQHNNSSFGQQPDHVYWPRALTASLTARPNESNPSTARESFCITKATAILQPDITSTSRGTTPQSSSQPERSIRPKPPHPVDVGMPLDFSSTNSFVCESLNQQASVSGSHNSSGPMISLSSKFATFEGRSATLDSSPEYLQRCMNSANRRGSGFSVASSLNHPSCASGTQNSSRPIISLSSNFSTFEARRSTAENSLHLNNCLGYLQRCMGSANRSGSGFNVASATRSSIPSTSRVSQISSTSLASMWASGLGGGIARSEGTSVFDLAATMAPAEEIVTDPFISPFS